MMGITTYDGVKFPTKKALKAHIGDDVSFIETSMFGNEFKGAGEYVVVGPCPHTSRKWYAQVTVDGNGSLVKVK